EGHLTGDELGQSPAGTGVAVTSISSIALVTSHEEHAPRVRHSKLRDGLIAGFLGATSVAVWFFIVVLFVGRPLDTVIGLGRGLFSLFGPGHHDSAAVLIIGYTIFHYVAFFLVGLLVAVIVHFADRQPTILAGALILFVALEIGFVAVSSVLASSP